jgi:hypothetical protein
MANVLNGRITVFEDNSYAVDISTLANPTIRDADVYTYTYPGGVLKQWNGVAWVDYTGFILYQYDGVNWNVVT